MRWGEAKRMKMETLWAFLKNKWALLASDYSLVGLDLESFELLGLLGLS